VAENHWKISLIGYSEVSCQSLKWTGRRVSSFEQSGEPVMKQEPGLKAPGTFDFEGPPTLTTQKIEAFP
jgi:hypothetical protein